MNEFEMLHNARDVETEEDEFLADLKDCAWNTLHDNPGVSQMNWESLMVYRYAAELCDCFGPDSDKWRDKLSEMFMHDSYEDELTGERYKFCEWSEIFANKYSVEIYDKLVDARLEIKPV